MTELQRILMERDDLTAQEAKQLMAEVREEFFNGNTEALYDIGLEDDYIFDLF